jgi:type VI secretion system protein ImpM
VSPGFFGKIPAAGDFVSWNLPRAFTDRWDRWMSRDLIEHPSRGPLDPRAWRFTVPAGIFCDAPCAGVWRMSEDRAGRRYPFVIAAVGAAPDPGDPWFDDAARLLRSAAELARDPAGPREALRRLPAPAAVTSTPAGMLFWNDDWEVRELRFADIHDLAANGLRAMRSPRVEQPVS